MAVPTHREGCHTRTIKTTCRDCGEEVYYFSCTCESKVFFDRLGNPWPLHEDKCVPYLIRTLKKETGLSDKAIMERVKDFAKQKHVDIPPELYIQLSEGTYTPRKKLQVQNITPYDESIVVEGVILEINQNININKKLGASGPMAAMVLGELADGNWAQMILRQNDTELELFAFQFTFLFPQSFIKKRSLTTGKRLAAALDYFQPIGREPVWICRKIDA